MVPKRVAGGDAFCRQTSGTGQSCCKVRGEGTLKGHPSFGKSKNILEEMTLLTVATTQATCRMA